MIFNHYLIIGVKLMATATLKVPMASNLLPLREVPRTGRATRKPSHRFEVRYRPYQIQPIMIAPVWPGETMKNLLMQARVITDPIKNPLLGWWNETYFFYVKLTDLADRDALTNMLVTNASSAALATAADVDTYHSAGGINYTQKSLDLITQWYFRDEDETVLQGEIDGLPLARSDAPGWMQSAKDATVVGELQHELPGENPSLPSHMSAFTEHYAQWEAMVSLGLTTSKFEDWVQAFGVNIPSAEHEDKRKPELIRYVKQWAYPAGTVNPADGNPANAVTWSMAERADKDRFIKEPGFIVGITCARPKVYFSKQTGSLSHFMNDAFAWLPESLQEQPYAALKKFIGGGAGVGPLGVNMTNDYWVDMKDLALHGDQFVNFSLAETDAGFMALPTAGMNKRYPTAAMVDALFTNAAPLNKVRADGVVDLTILGRVEETTH